jgi:hypothetical protein
MTAEMRRELAARRAGRLTIAWHANNPRDAHLQHNVPPWKRRPFRRLADGGFELQGDDGQWRRADR